MKRSAIIVLIIAAATTLWTWWPQRDAKQTQPTEQENRFMTISGKIVAPEKVAAIRVVSWDSENKAPVVFEVAKKGNDWIIPSHFDYPADGGTMVGTTSGAFLNLVAGPLVSNDPSKHADLGVIDPLREGTSNSDGRGKRVSLRDDGGALLVDIIIGRKAEQGDSYYARMANSDEVYKVQVNPDIKTAFRDWVKTDLLNIEKSQIYSVIISDQSVDEEFGVVRERAQTVMTQKASGDGWESKQSPAGKITNQDTMTQFEGELTGLRLIGVRPFSNNWLQSRGFYVTSSGTLVGNEGGLQINLKDGLVYHLFFGEIALGDEQDTTADATRQRKPGDETEQNRYMAIFVQYVPEYDDELTAIEKEISAAAQPEGAETKEATDQTGDKPAAKEENKQAKSPEEKKAARIAEGQEKAGKLVEKYSKFFYVISDDSFKKLRPPVESLFKSPDPEKPAEEAAEEPAE